MSTTQNTLLLFVQTSVSFRQLLAISYFTIDLSISLSVLFSKITAKLPQNSLQFLHQMTIMTPPPTDVSLNTSPSLYDFLVSTQRHVLLVVFNFFFRSFSLFCHCKSVWCFFLLVGFRWFRFLVCVCCFRGCTGMYTCSIGGFNFCWSFSFLFWNQLEGVFAYGFSLILFLIMLG